MKQYSLMKLCGIGFIILSVWYSLYVISPPAPRPAEARVDFFSAERAFDHIKNIGQRPHPLGSKENNRVRNYLVTELNKLGLQPETQQGIAMVRPAALAGNVKNVLAKLPGTAPRKTIVLMAHYDSVPNGPGAADDGFGIAAILETLRALQARGPLKNNLWVLFTDGEERGLLGAQYFIQDNENQKQVDLAINIEARGTSGPSIMFETSPSNNNLIPAFAAASANPVANSLSYTIYKLIPNDTDLSAFKRAGINVLNFANIEGALNYHTRQDHPGNVSKSTLQHHGEQLLAAALYFGNNDRDLSGSSDMVYFNGLAGTLIYYPAGWSFPLALISGFCLLGYLIFLFNRKQISLLRYLTGTAAYAVIGLLAALITFQGWLLLKDFYPSFRLISHGEPYVYKWYFWCFSSLILSIHIAGFSWLQNKLGVWSVMAGIFTNVTILNVIIAWYIPTAGYLLLWPFLFALAGWIIVQEFTNASHWPALIILCIALFPTLFIITPYMSLVQIALSTGALWISMILFVFIIGLCWPLVSRIIREQASAWAWVLAAFALLCLGGAGIYSGFDADHKKHNSIIYAQDLDTGQSFWLSSDRHRDEWTSQFLGKQPVTDFSFDYSPYWHASFLKAPATYVKIEAPGVRVVSDSLANGLHYFNLKVSFPSGGLMARFESGLGADFKYVSIEGRPFYNHATPFPGQLHSLGQFYYYADLSRPLQIAVALPAEQSDAVLNIQVISKKWPQGLMQRYKPRTEDMMPIPFGISDAVIFNKTYFLK